MNRRLPPLNQLRAFEAAARHLSFKNAAEELNVTHAAISHQIKALEESLNTKLFLRGGRGVTLTDEARDFAQRMTEALDIMDGAVRGYKATTAADQITISTVPWYANRVLLPALEAFHTENPDFHIKFDFSYALVDLENSGADAALRHGAGQWPRLVSVRVHDDLLSPVCAPSLVKDVSLPMDTANLAGMTLAVGKGYEDAWQQYFELAGWQPDRKLNFIEFENRALATEFAIAGHGVALSDIITTGDEIRSGQLTLMSDVRLRPETGAYLVFTERRVSDERFELISDWIRGLFSALAVPK